MFLAGDLRSLFEAAPTAATSADARSTPEQAAEAGQIDVVKTLLNAGASHVTEKANGDTPMHVAHKRCEPSAAPALRRTTFCWRKPSRNVKETRPARGSRRESRCSLLATRNLSNAAAAAGCRSAGCREADVTACLHSRHFFLSLFRSLTPGLSPSLPNHSAGSVQSSPRTPLARASTGCRARLPTRQPRPPLPSAPPSPSRPSGPPPPRP